jgi:hypothetical protein
MKKCKKCEKEKDILDFFKNRGICKICFNEHMKERRPSKKIKCKENHKLCKSCGEEKHNMFFSDKNSYCKSCKAYKKRTTIKIERSKDETYNNEGYIYIIVNDAWTNYIKLGRTKNLNTRLRQYQTASPLRDYKMYFYKNVSDVSIIEEYFMKHYEHNNEWFLIEKDKAVKVIENIIYEYQLTKKEDI